MPRKIENLKPELMKDEFSTLDLNSVKSKYGNKFLELRRIINEHDPLSLLEDGAPEDEYEPGVKTIIVQLEGSRTKVQVQELVYREFLQWFGDNTMTGAKEACRKLAADIHAWAEGLSVT